MLSDLTVPSAVALGMFDGMHIGHQKVVQTAVRIALKENWQSVVYTFENHPRAMFSKAPAPLMSAEERRRAMLSLGVEHVDMVPFDMEMARLTPEEFIEMLARRYRLGALVAGSDYTFGHKGAGTVETLRLLAPRFGYQFSEVPFVTLAGEKVSSTRIREALAMGCTDLARRMLGADAGIDPR